MKSERPLRFQKFVTLNSYRLALPIASLYEQTWQPVLAAAGGSGQSDKNTIRAGRRRPSGPGSGERERADAPQRRRPASGGGMQPPSGSMGGSGLPGLPGGSGASVTRS